MTGRGVRRRVVSCTNRRWEWARTVAVDVCPRTRSTSMCVFVISRLHYNGTPDRSSAYPPPRYFTPHPRIIPCRTLCASAAPPRTVSSPRAWVSPRASRLGPRTPSRQPSSPSRRTRPNRPPSTRRPPSRGRVRVSSRVSVRVWVWGPSRGVISPVAAHRRPSLSPGEARRTGKTPTPARRRVNRGAPVDEDDGDADTSPNRAIPHLVRSASCRFRSASPRMGTASPRIGAASPRIGAASPRMRADSRERRRRRASSRRRASRRRANPPRRRV